MKISKRLTTLGIAAMMTVVISSCGSSVATKVQSQIEPNQTPASTVKPSDKSTKTETKANQKIEEQSFPMTLPSLGEVEFVAYSPDLGRNRYADVTFVIEKDGEKVQKLEGFVSSDVRNGVEFKEIQAVTFKDYNKDGNKDIITICKYKKSDSEFSETRIYRGKSDGKFTFDEKLSNDTNAAVSEQTVQSVLKYLGVDVKKVDTKWKQAYIDNINNDKNNTPAWAGYALIYVDSDEIPELVKIGSSEAMGCMIVNYAMNKTWETQLDRRNFTYIPEANYLCNSDGNMDRYFDSVYRIGKEKLTLVHAGIYGAINSSTVKKDEQGRPIYEYRFDGKTLSKEEYQAQLNAVYNTTKAMPGYTEGKYYDAERVIKEIEKL